MATLVRVRDGRMINAHQSPTKTPAHGGDWIYIANKNDLRRWLSDGTVELPFGMTEETAARLLGSDCGVLVLSQSRKHNLSNFEPYSASLKFKFSDKLSLPYGRTMIWSPGTPLVREQVLLGFSRIEPTREGYDAWEVAAMLAGPKALAMSAGGAEEQAKTKELIGDLRVPLYNPGKIWIKKTDATQQMIGFWREEVEAGAHHQHAFLRAIYSSRVMLCTLPHNWMILKKVRR